MSEFLAQQRARGEELTESAQAVLDGLYPGQARVQVTVDLDPNWEVRQEKILPESPILVTDKTTKNDTVEVQANGAGDPSAAAQAAGVSGPRSSKKDNTAERTYEPFRGTATKSKLAPDVRRLSVALVLDEKLQLGADKLDKVQQLVKSCVGFSAERDAFAVHVEKFPDIKPEPVGGESGLLDAVKEYVPVAAQLLGVVLVLMFLKGMLKRAGEKPPAAPAQSAEDVPEEQLSPEDSVKRMRRDIEKAIADDPAAVSRMFEAWLTEVKS